MFKKLENLNGQTVVITGVAGGIGMAIAASLASLGARIIGIVRKNAYETQAILNNLPNASLNHTVLIADINNKEQLANIVASIEKCDILINSAGYSKVIPHDNFDYLSEEFFDSIIKTNLTSVFSTIKHFVPLLKQSPNGLIINISSAAGVRTGGSNLAYAAAKAGVESLTRNLAIALAPTRVVSICPSAIDTGFLDLPKEFYSRVANTTPLKRAGEPEDIANAVEAIATTMRFTTGNSFLIDGGRTI